MFSYNRSNNMCSSSISYELIYWTIFLPNRYFSSKNNIKTKLLFCVQMFFYRHIGQVWYIIKRCWTLLHMLALSSTQSEAAGIEPWSVAVFALAASPSNHAARSHPPTLLDHPLPGQIFSPARIDFIHHSARSRPLLS